MFFYAANDGSPISQCHINESSKIEITKIKQIDIEYNVCYTIFDYEVGNNLPPCPHFLKNFLTSKVYVFSVPLSSELLKDVNKKAMLNDYCSTYIGYPKTGILGDFELGWIGIEAHEKYKILSNIQINGIYRDSINRKQQIQFYKTMIDFCKKEINSEEIIVPTAKTLRLLTDRFSNHPERAIMETPYSSKVLKGFSKFLLNKKIYASKYLNDNELEFYKMRDIE